MWASVARRRALPFALVALLAAAETASAGPCDSLGGDADGDGICDDGNGSGLVGDVPCSCQPGSPPTCNDGCDDNCPWTVNPGQLDVGRLGAPDVPDGIGDACQCLDVSDDGRANVLDAVLLRREVASQPPALAAPQKCLGAGASACDAGDFAPLRAALALVPPAPANVCVAAGDCAASADCPAGITCDLGSQRCEKNDGQACVQNSECLDGACCADTCTALATDVNNCGGCNIQCANPHGTTSCASALCSPVCDFGAASCDNNVVNGCERTVPTLPGPVTALGSFTGDGSTCASATTHFATGAKALSATFQEANALGCSPTSALIELTAPALGDYQLRVTAPAGVTCTHWNGSTYIAGCTADSPPGQTARIRLVNPESCHLGLGDGTDQTFTAAIDVLLVGPPGCDYWGVSLHAGGGC